jgi:hypothetical protein
MSEKKENNVTTNSFLADRLAGKVDHLGNVIEKKEAKPVFIKTEEVVEETDTETPTPVETPVETPKKKKSKKK